MSVATAAHCQLAATLKPRLGQSPAHFRRSTDSASRHKGCPLLLESGKVVLSAAAPRRQSAAAAEKAIPAQPQSAAAVENVIPPRRRSAAAVENAIPPSRRSAAVVEKAIPPRRQSAAAVENPSPPLPQSPELVGSGVPAPIGRRGRVTKSFGRCPRRAQAVHQPPFSIASAYQSCSDRRSWPPVT